MCPNPNSENSPTPDILVLEENILGNDIVIGDVHGEITVLAHLAKDLGPNDRLIIVGDLVDRGEDSPAIFDFIEKYNSKNNTKIFAVKGNHEAMLLDYIDTRLNEEKHTFQEIKVTTYNYVYNGGAWATKLSDEKLAELKKQIEALPFIIHVTGRRPFNVVHADMPFNDNVLLSKIKKNDLTLSESEKRYCTWARENGPDVLIKNTGRNSKSFPTYCGHSILDGLRADTHHINLDFGSFDTHHIGVVNHTLQNCMIYTTAEVLDSDARFIRDELNKNFELNNISGWELSRNKAKNNFVDKIGLKNSDIKSFIIDPTVANESKGLLDEVKIDTVKANEKKYPINEIKVNEVPRIIKPEAKPILDATELRTIARIKEMQKELVTHISHLKTKMNASNNPHSNKLTNKKIILLESAASILDRFTDNFDKKENINSYFENLLITLAPIQKGILDVSHSKEIKSQLSKTLFGKESLSGTAKLMNEIVKTITHMKNDFPQQNKDVKTGYK